MSPESMKPRPDIIHGKTYRTETGSGVLYTTINDAEDGSMFEVFVTIGKSGGFTASLTEAVGRLISICLRFNVPPAYIAKQLVGIRSPRATMSNGRWIHSVPDAIGQAMLQHMGKTEKDIETTPEDPTDEEVHE